MCTIAGYNGTRRAAPILVDMMRRLEGLDGGFYTGIATIHEGRIYSAKVAGDLERLLSTTDALKLPGTIGFIHSRTPGSVKSDFAEMGHPFTAEIGGETQTALILNGCGGVFGQDIVTKIPGAALRMQERGYTLKSHNNVIGNVTMPDGSKVHSNDVRCQMVCDKIANGMDAAFAMQEVFSEIPAEAVSLVLSLTEPEAICFARLCMPMHVGFCDHGAYMSTAPLAFAEETCNYTLLPPMSYGKVYRKKFEAAPFVHAPATVAPITPQVMAKAYEYIEEKLRTPMPFTKIGWSDVLNELYPKADCTQRATVAYQVISELHRQGRLKVETKYIEGQTAELRAPVFWLQVKD